jgi:hypothetical protein
MHSPWKLATLGLVALGAVVGTSSLTTAYLMRPPATAPAITPPVLTQAPERRPPIVRVAPTPPRKAVTPASPSVVSAVVETAATAAQERAPMTAPEATPVADCDTGGDRALRIAKPGALGAVLGAGLGAAGGAIANGGKGAGQGALIGGLAGAVLGAGYGAYKTQNECGTILGDDRSDGGGRIAPATASRAPHEDAMAPLQSTRPSADRIHIYDAR